MRNNIVTAIAGDKLFIKTDSVFQYDYGLKLVISGVTLPQEYDVHFSNTNKPSAKTVKGDSSGVLIPDEYLLNGEDVHAWVYLHTEGLDDDGETVYHIQIPVVARAAIAEEQITPVQHNVIEEALEEMAEAVAETQANVTHYPYINENGYWMVYDAQNEQFVNTGVNASGSADIIDDTAGSGVGNRTWSANKLTDTFNGKISYDENEHISGSDLPNYEKSIIDAVFAVNGVSNVKVKANFTNNAEDGVPANKICVIVNNGSADNIAGAIAESNTSGLETYGTVSRTISGKTIYFSRPSSKSLSVGITLKGLDSTLVLSDVETSIKTAVRTMINQLDVGEKINTQKIRNTIYGAVGQYVSKFLISDVTITCDNTTYHDEFSPAWDEKCFVSSSSNITATLVAFVDDNAGVGDTDKVWPADKSADTAQHLLSEINKRPELKATAEEEPDLDIVDTNGNALARFIDGGFIVKQFDGRKYSTYSVTGSFTRTALSLTINHPFKKGQKVVLHVEYGAKPWDYGAPVKYYEGNKMVADIYKGDSAYYEHIVTSDCNSISAVYESSAFSRTLDLTFEVSVLGDIQIEPTVLTIKTDGTGDYTNLKDCLAAIGTTANDVLNPYRIEIYPGTYNVLSDYTTEEISNIHDDDDPSSPSVQEGFVGPKLLNGMSLVGIGDPSEIVLNGYLDTTTWTSKYRNQISTLNLQGTSSIENLTVIATNLRYCVHDDWQFNGAKHLKRMVKNCVFRGYNIAYAPYTTYGAGCPISAGYYEFIDCDFGENAGLHASAIQHDRLQCRLVHCKGHGFRIGDSSISLTTMPGYSTYTFVDCDFKWIWSSSPDSEARAKVMGMCGQNVLYDLPSGMLYNTGDTVIDPRTDLSVGDVVEWYADTDHGFKWRTATSADKAHGVVVYEDSTDTYIQTSGYVRTDRVGITSFNLGDYVGLSSGSMVVINSATDAIGRIVYVNNDGDGFIKLDWRE